MTSDRARKKAIRDRMAATGEPYTEAARNLGMAPGDAAAGATAGAAGAAADVIAAATATMAESGCRLTLRREWAKEPAGQRGLLGAAVAAAGRMAVKAVSDLVPPGVTAFFNGGFVIEGIAEPSTGRYLVGTADTAEAGFDGHRYTGRPGQLLTETRTWRVVPERDYPLWLLTLLAGVSSAVLEGEEAVRGTQCRKYAVRLTAPQGTAQVEELTAWMDASHIRQVRAVEERQDKSEFLGTVSYGRRSWTTYTLELRDFGTSLEELDWSRLPSVPNPETDPKPEARDNQAMPLCSISR